jgi:hypothetical protein
MSNRKRKRAEKDDSIILHKAKRKRDRRERRPPGALTRRSGADEKDHLLEAALASVNNCCFSDLQLTKKQFNSYRCVLSGSFQQNSI